jgi:hypothetical protein
MKISGLALGAEGVRRGRAQAVVTAGQLLPAIVLAFVASSTHATQIDTGNPDVSLRWDNTVKYSTAVRVKGADDALLTNPNLDDGDRNFGKGIVSNRFDLLSELDFSYQKRFGFRVSGAAWYDTVYNRRNDNPGLAGGAFPNQTSVPYDRFTDATRRMQGRDSELLDAFVYGKFDLGGHHASLRVGRHSLIWGESLFFGANAIAGGQMPVDVAKLVSVPNTQFKEVIRPVPQISGQLQLSPNVSVGAYYQTKFVPSRLQAVGSYFSNNDLTVDGAENMWGMTGLVPRLATQDAKNSGQGGLQLRIRTDEADFGLYAIRFHSKTPQLVPKIGMGPTGPQPVGYYLAYHENVNAFGASVSKTFGDFNVAVEASMRTNQDLASSQAADLSGLGMPAKNNSDDPGYAVGRTAHVNVSVLGNLGRNFLWKEATLTGEMAWNRVLSITKNPDAVDPNATRDGIAFRVVVEPMYRQVFPGVDISVPIGVSYAPKGSRPMAMHPNAWIPAGGGDISLGLNASYLDAWRFSLSYTHYYGPLGTLTDMSANNAYTYKQTMKDRDFIALSMRYTF